MHRHGQVGRQRPRRRGPDQRGRAIQLGVARLQLQRDGDRRVLPVGVDVVHLGLGRRQRRLAAPAVPEHPVAGVDQALVPERLERPHDAFHVVQVERLVVVVEVHPAGLPGDVVAPLPRVAQHRDAAGVVERLDAHRLDLGLVLDPELLLGLDLGRQAVAVPAEPALDVAAAHGLVPRHDVLDVAGEQVAVVRQAVGERWAVVEDELVRAVGRRPGGPRPRRETCRRPPRSRARLAPTSGTTAATERSGIPSGRSPRAVSLGTGTTSAAVPPRLPPTGTHCLPGRLTTTRCRGDDGPRPSGSTGACVRSNTWPVLPEAPR